MENKNLGIEFPLEAFPHIFSDAILEYEDKLHFDRNASALAVLVHTASILDMGTTFEIMSRKQPPIIWANIIQDSGTAKGHLMDNYMEHLYNQNTELPIDAMFTYKATDATMEGLIKKHIGNSKGIMLYKDELPGMVKGFNKYQSGDDKEKYLSLWDGKGEDVIRSSDTPLKIAVTKVNIMGATQPEKVPILFPDESITEGFATRFLNAEVYDSGYKKKSRVKVDRSKMALLNYSINAPLWNIQAQNYIASPEADECWLDWSDARTKQYFDYKNFKLYQGKMDSYAIRLMGILHAMHLNDYKSLNDKAYLPIEVPLHIVEKATMLCDFFMGQYERMLKNLSAQRFPTAIQNELSKQSPEFQMLYNQLNGKEYTNGELVEHFSSYCKAQNVHKRILKNNILFKSKGEHKGKRYTKTLRND